MSQASKRPFRTFYYASRAAIRGNMPDRVAHSATLRGAHSAATRRLYDGDFVKAVIYDLGTARRYVLMRSTQALRTAGQLP